MGKRVSEKKGVAKVQRPIMILAREAEWGEYDCYHFPPSNSVLRMKARDLNAMAKIGIKVVVNVKVPAGAVVDIVVNGGRTRWVIRPSTSA